MSWMRTTRVVANAGTVVLTLTLVLALVCTRETDAQAPVRGGTLRIGWIPDAKTLDPHFSVQFAERYVLYAVYNTLVGLDRTFGVIPELARAWQVSADGKQVTFQLQRGVKFHDGTDFTAETVKWNIERILDPQTKSPQRRSGRGGSHGRRSLYGAVRSEKAVRAPLRRLGGAAGFHRIASCGQAVRCRLRPPAHRDRSLPRGRVGPGLPRHSRAIRGLLGKGQALPRPGELPRGPRSDGAAHDGPHGRGGHHDGRRRQGRTSPAERPEPQGLGDEAGGPLDRPSVARRQAALQQQGSAPSNCPGD